MPHADFAFKYSLAQDKLKTFKRVLNYHFIDVLLGNERSEVKRVRSKRDRGAANKTPVFYFA
ncbi:hypothetical protein CAMRE0001_2804 [Campylobacter rectus RM3267]|uniref:Uncharacterized protein n=2 Tax=Campylobacter rectus TaxID=203 RepID=A0A6G5QNM6_CAMRE|nr:hypothetical protein CAMRE0001_2804 [Campylobacter rectus RM3267]QCD47172.1 hypothetical protein CRECT_1536 [Campylobacter rectus]